MKKSTLPAGEDARRTWRIINRYAPKDADAFAAAVWRYAETGEATLPEKVAPEDWANAQAEVERIVASRTAGKKGGESGKGVPRNEGNRNAAKSIAKSIAESKPTRGREDEDEDEEEDKNDNPKTEDDDARETRAPTSGTSVLIPSISSDFGIHPPSPSSDFGAWARMQKDPVNVALAVSRESEKVRKVYGWTLKECREAWGREEGTRRFVEECVDFNAECEAGEEPRNRGAALVARLRALADGAGMVAPSKVSPPPKVEAAPVQAEPALPPTVEAVEVEEENPAPPSPMPELVEDAPKPTDAVSLALCVCNGGEDERGMVAGLLAVCKRIPGCYEEGFLKRCKAYSQNDTRTPLNFESFLRGAFPDTVWNQAEQAARTNGEL